MSEGLRRSIREGRNQINRFQPAANFHGGDNGDDTEPARGQPPRHRRLERDLPDADGDGDRGGGEGMFMAG